MKSAVAPSVTAAHATRIVMIAAKCMLMRSHANSTIGKLYTVHNIFITRTLKI